MRPLGGCGTYLENARERGDTGRQGFRSRVVFMRWAVSTRGFVRATSWAACAVVWVGGATLVRAEPPAGEAPPVVVVRPRADSAVESPTPAPPRSPPVVVLTDIMPLAPLDFEWRLSVKVIDLSDLPPLVQSSAEPQGLSLGETPGLDRGNPPH